MADFNPIQSMPSVEINRIARCLDLDSETEQAALEYFNYALKSPDFYVLAALT